MAELLTHLLQNSIPEPYCTRSHDTTMWRDGLYGRHEGKMRSTVWPYSRTSVLTGSRHDLDIEDNDPVRTEEDGIYIAKKEVSGETNTAHSNLQCHENSPGLWTFVRTAGELDMHSPLSTLLHY